MMQLPHGSLDTHRKWTGQVITWKDHTECITLTCECGQVIHLTSGLGAREAMLYHRIEELLLGGPPEIDWLEPKVSGV